MFQYMKNEPAEIRMGGKGAQFNPFAKALFSKGGILPVQTEIDLVLLD